MATPIERARWSLVCLACEAPGLPNSGFCSRCGARVEVRYNGTARITAAGHGKHGLYLYQDLLPIDLPSDLSMGEGGTPLVRSRVIGPSLGLNDLFFKLESCNPTGSFKDRIAYLIASQCVGSGVRTILTITSGNAGAAIAAYAARAGLNCVVLYIADAPASKRLQMHAFGSTILLLTGLQDDPENLNRAFAAAFALGEKHSWRVTVMSHFYDPLCVEAYKTIAFEICDELAPRTPAAVYFPVGGGGLFAANWKGFREYLKMGRIARVPTLIAVQPASAASVAAGLAKSADDAIPVEARSRISGVNASYTSDGSLVIRALRETGGHCCCPTDEEVYRAQMRLAREEGIFAEPAGALALAGLLKDIESGRTPVVHPVVCLVSSAGFKDRESAEELFSGKTLAKIHFSELNRITELAAI